MKFSFYVVKRAILVSWVSAVFAFTLGIAEARIVEGDSAWLSSQWLNDNSVETSINSLSDDIVVVSLFYTNCPNTCNLTIQKYKQLEAYFEKNKLSAQLVLMSLDPKNDTPAVLNAYRESRGLTQDNWHFLTSTETQVSNAARSLGYQFTRLDDHVFHRMKIFVLNPSGVIMDKITMKTKLEDIKFTDKREVAHVE